MKISIMVKVDDNLDFCQHFRKISILVNIVGIIELGQNFPQILVLVKISEKCRFGSKFENMSTLVKIYKNLEAKKSKFFEISILVKIVGNSRSYQYVDFGQKLHLNVIYSQTFRIISIKVNICKYRGFGKIFRKISIVRLLNIYKNLDFGQNSWKSRFWSK